MARRMRIQPIALVLIVVAVLLVILGIIYLTQTANHLPGFVPGKLTTKLRQCNPKKTNEPCFTPRHFTKRGIAAFGLAAIALVGAWYTSGLRKSSSSAAH